MLEDVVKKRRVQEAESAQEDLAFWLSRGPEERVAAVDYLRKQY